MEATAIVPVRSLAWLLAEARMIHFLVVILCVYLSSPSCPSGGLGDVGDVVIPLDEGEGNRLSQVLSIAAGGGEDGPLLSGDVFSSQIVL